jgi:hypothetical protein
MTAKLQIQGTTIHKPLKIMVDIIFALCSNQTMRISHNHMLNVADLLAPCSLLALLIIGRGAGAG